MAHVAEPLLVGRARRISQTVFDGGLRGAQTDQARAAYDATVAGYRQTVLTAFQEVEDNLAALRILAGRGRRPGRGGERRTASRSRVTTNQYKAGTVSYLDVVVAQAAALDNERTAVDIRARRMVASRAADQGARRRLDGLREHRCPLAARCWRA